MGACSSSAEIHPVIIKDLQGMETRVQCDLNESGSALALVIADTLQLDISTFQLIFGGKDISVNSAESLFEQGFHYTGTTVLLVLTIKPILHKLNLGAAYDDERMILNLQGKALSAPDARVLARALAGGHVKWVLARRGIDEIDVETASALTAALQSDTCCVSHIDLRNCCPSNEAVDTLVKGLSSKYAVNDVELEATRLGSEEPPAGYWDM